MMSNLSLHAVDYAVLGLYLLLVVVLVARVSRRSPDAEELFLAGRSLGVGVVGLSLFASNISSTTLIGLPGAAWQHGISVANYEWMAALVLIFSAFFVVPLLLKAGVTTLPEFLERRFDARLRKYLSGVTLFLTLVLDTAGSLYAGALVMMLFVPGLELGWTCAGLALFAGVYTAAGGLRAVAYTDVLQALVLLLGSALLFVLVFAEFDYSWGSVVERLEPDKLSLLRPLDDPALPWLGTLIGLPILGFYYWTMNQYVAQRLLGARSAEVAARGALLAAGLKLLPLFLMVIPGAMAAALFTDLERADEVFPRLVATYAPAGVAGLILAGLLAAIMSSVDSALNSSATLLTLDFVQPRRPNMTPQQLATIGRVFTFLLVGLAALWAPAIDNFPGLFAYLQQTFSYIVPPLVAVFLLGLWWPRLGPRGALYACVGGHLLSLACFLSIQGGVFELHFTIVAGLLFAATLFIAAILAPLLGGRDAAPAASGALVDRRRLPRLSGTVYATALALTLLTAGLVWTFR